MATARGRKKQLARGNAQDRSRETAAPFDYSRLSASFAKLGKPAQRALINNRIYSEKDLAQWTVRDVAALHGIGPSSLPFLEKALSSAGLKFRK
jgi:hypothetical protein